MNFLMIGAVFLIALVVAVFAGPGRCFVLVYLPSLILFNQVLEISNIPHIPVSCASAPLYAILISLPFAGGTYKFKLCSMDVIFFLLLLSGAMTGWTTGQFETGVNIFRNDLLQWMLPYYVARIVFRDWQLRRLALYSLIPVMGLILLIAFYETRFYPYFYLHLLQNAGMGNHVSPMAYNRFGLYRVAGPVEHPIYFGNMCVGMIGMIAVLATTSGYKIYKPIILASLGACVVCTGLSLSFTPYLGLMASVAIAVTLIFIPFTRKLVIPATIAVATALFVFTYTVATTPLPPKPDNAYQVEGSLWTRKLIIHESWMIATKAPTFGNGVLADYSDVEDFDLASVDNSYMQFTMNRGWVYTALWVSLGLFHSFRMTRGFLNVRSKSQIIPLAVATAVPLGLMLSMYTVWAGALYTTVWMILLGLSSSLVDQILESARPMALPAAGSFPVIQQRQPMMPYRPVPV